MTALRRRHQLMAALKEQFPIRDGRKTTRTVEIRRPPHQMPDYRLCVLIPAAWQLRAPGAGSTGFIGVKVEPDPISGPLAVATGKDLTWVATQMGTFLLKLAAGEERIITAPLRRQDDPDREVTITITPGMAALAIEHRRIVKVTA